MVISENSYYGHIAEEFLSRPSPATIIGCEVSRFQVWPGGYRKGGRCGHWRQVVNLQTNGRRSSRSIQRQNSPLFSTTGREVNSLTTCCLAADFFWPPHSLYSLTLTFSHNSLAPIQKLFDRADPSFVFFVFLSFNGILLWSPALDLSIIYYCFAFFKFPALRPVQDNSIPR